MVTSTKNIFNGIVKELAETQKHEIIGMSAAFAENTLSIIKIACKRFERLRRFHNKRTFEKFMARFAEEKAESSQL